MILALLLGACGSASGQELPMDGGEPDDGGVPDTVVACEFEGDERTWAEFPVNPGVTEVTVCWDGPEPLGPYCQRYVAPYFEGTSIGLVSCQDAIRSITVHR